MDYIPKNYNEFAIFSGGFKAENLDSLCSSLTSLPVEKRDAIRVAILVAYGVRLLSHSNQRTFAAQLEDPRPGGARSLSGRCYVGCHRR
jgi:hypothetical protein